MKYIFDTNIIIGFLNNDSSIVRFLAEQSYVNVSSITVGEMYFGAENSGNVQKNYSIFRSFFKLCNILEITESTAERYAAIKIDLKKAGKPIPENDIWIAANALEFNLAIVTRDKHFKKIDVGMIEI